MADLAEEMKAWKDIDIELLKFLRSTSQGVEQTASNYTKLANYCRTLVELSKASSTQMQVETGKLVMLVQDSIRQMQSDLPSKQELKSDLNHLKTEIQQTKALSARQPLQWGPLVLAALLSIMTGWMGWRMGRVDGFQKGEIEIMNLFGGRTNMFYWQRMRMENSDLVKDCRKQKRETCVLNLP